MGKRSGKDGFNRPFAKLAKLKPKPSEAQEKQLGSGTPRQTTAPEPRERGRAAGESRPQSEEELFLAEMAGARPLSEAERGNRVGVPPAAPRPRPGPPTEDAEVLAELADLVAGTGPFDISDSDEYIEGIAEGIDRRLLRRLRAGDYAVQAHLDLHGLKRDEARERVGRFLEESRRRALRCVLIVHGRGLHSKDQIPVLKQAVVSWLERGHLARSVLAFVTARPADGGAGAVYVLLRR